MRLVRPALIGGLLLVGALASKWLGRPSPEAAPRDGSAALAGGSARVASSSVADVEAVAAPVSLSQDVVHEPALTPVRRYVAASTSALPVPASVKLIVSRATNSTAAARLAAVDALGNRLGAQERAALYAFLLDPDRTDGLTPAQEYVLVNEIMKLLRQQHDHAPEFGAIMAAVFRDTRQAVVVRDYAIQHLGEWCLAGDFNADLDAVFREALAQKDSSIAGTALVALDKLAAETADIPAGMVEDAALVLASDTSANAGTRAAALAVCGARGVTNALSVARQAAVQSAVPLCVASIEYVGLHGGEQDLAWLAELAGSEADLVVSSAQLATERIAVRDGIAVENRQRQPAIAKSRSMP